jgi:MinD superfamily P-loop ATPase
MTSGPLRIAVASGKGGTGKTTIATNLAVVLSEMGEPVAYVDCDVEEPNGHLFLRPTIRESRPVSIPVPEVDEPRCTLCGACGAACRHSAILALPKKVLTFPKLCHGCGGCSLACPEGAIREVPRVTGVVEEGAAGPVAFLQGRLDIGEAMAPPVIRALLAAVPRDRVAVLDAPPGTSCPVIESVRTADVVLLVTEPTPFGLNDLKLAVEMLRELGLPFGVAINRAGIGDESVRDYCAAEGISVLLERPNDLESARAYSRGELAIAARPGLKPLFTRLFGGLLELRDGAARPSPGTTRRADAEGWREAPLPAVLPAVADGADCRELVVISGKGGTGKTSIVASFFALAGTAAVSDCDVDAADLHLVLDPVVIHREPFSGGEEAVIEAARCTGCGECDRLCRFGAIEIPGTGAGPARRVDPISCEGCGVCADNCPEGAISMVASLNGERFVSETRHGPMTHARLGIAEENSGKLVSLVKRDGKAVCPSKGRDLLICDGSPGIGCPVIASIAGARMVLIVTEPTLSGLHDLERVAELCRQFGVEAGVCINKADINPDMSDRIEARSAALGLGVIGRIRYDESVTAAQVRRLSVVEHGRGPAAEDIRAAWERISAEIGCPKPKTGRAKDDIGV